MNARGVQGTRRSGFSLTETVIALGLFAFCILGVLAMIPVGMNAARGVVNESTAINLAESFFGAWQVAPTNSREFPIPGIFPADQVPVPLIVPDGSTNSGGGDIYFLDDGTQTADATRAAIRLNYSVRQADRLATVNLEFIWPVTERSQTNLPTQQRRSFSRVFSR